MPKRLPPLERHGLTVKYCSAPFKRGAKKGDLPAPPGWYVYAESSEGPHVCLNLRFVRQIDAQLAKSALAAAGLDNVRKMIEAGPELVIQTAYGALQW